MSVASERPTAAATQILHTWSGSVDRPHAAMIEIADRCNEACVHCYQLHGNKGEMSTTDLCRVIDQLAEIGVLFLTVSGGEPTLRSDFLDIISHARSRGFVLSVYSNCQRIDSEMASELARLGVAEVQTSIYSHRAEVHDRITRVPGSFERTVGSVRRLVDLGIHVRARTPLMSVNEAELDDYGTFIRSLGATVSVDSWLMAREDGSSVEQDLAPSPAGLERFMLGRYPGKVPDEKPLDAAPCGACGAAGGKLHIEPNGEVRPCTQLNRPLGDAVQDGLESAWVESAEARAVRRLTWADLHGCRDCDLRDYCTRCYATAVNEAGDALGPYARACRDAVAKYGAVHRRDPDIVGPGRRSLGPFKEDAVGRLRRFDYKLTERDRVLAQRHPWLAPGRGGGSAGPIVELRRSRDGAALSRPANRRSAPRTSSAKVEGLATANRWRGM